MKGINSQSLEDTQVGYISEKYTLDNTLEKYTLAQKSLVMVQKCKSAKLQKVQQSILEQKSRPSVTQLKRTDKDQNFPAVKQSNWGHTLHKLFVKEMTIVSEQK